MRSTCLSLVLLLAAGVLACGEDFSDRPAEEAATGGGAGQGTAEAGVGGDSGGGAGGSGGSSSDGGSGGTPDDGGTGGSSGDGGAGGESTDAGTGGSSGDGGTGGSSGGAGGTGGDGGTGGASGGAGGTSGDGGTGGASGGAGGTGGDGGSGGQLTCTAPYDNCDLDDTNGCETNIDTHIQHCGGCSIQCQTMPNMVTTCAGGDCFLDCDPGFGDCNNNPFTDGCETNVNTSVTSCGACGNACPYGANSEPKCTGGSCGIQCATGFADCDNDPANGCEVNTLTSTTHCGACNNACGTANGAASCNAGVCAIACNTGYDNCDQAHANGCEVTLATDALHCGWCGHACGTACSASLCSPTLVPSIYFEITALAQDTSNLYVATADYDGNEFSLFKYPKNGSPLTGLAGATTAVTSIAVDDSHVFFAAEVLFRVGLQGSGLATIGTGVYFSEVLADKSSLFAGTSESSVFGVAAVPKDGGDRTELVFDTMVRRMAMDSTTLYWLGGGGLTSMARAGGPTFIPPGAQNAVVIAADNAGQYWGTSTGYVMTASKDWATQRTLASSQGNISAIAVDDTHVYWSNANGLHRVVKTGGAIQKLAAANAVTLLVDATQVYYVPSSWAVLYRVSK